MQLIDTEKNNLSLKEKKGEKKTNQIITLKISHDNKYLAVGKSDGQIIVYEFLNLDYFNRNDKNKINENSYFNLLNESPLIVFKGQKKEIIEICWSFKVK